MANFFLTWFLSHSHGIVNKVLRLMMNRIKYRKKRMSKNGIICYPEKGKYP